MKYTQLGKTGAQVSVVGYGGMRFDMEQSIEANAELVNYGFERGITYFDTAPGYCSDKSETIFGTAFKSMPRDKFFVADKLMPQLVENASDACDKVKLSLERLNVDYIDFFHVWCIRNMELYQRAMMPDGLYEGLLKCRDEGLIKHIFISSHLQGDAVKEVIDSGKFAGVLQGVNIINFLYRRVGLQAARKQGCGSVAMNPLAGGEISRHQDNFKFICTGDETPVEAALRFVIANPYVDVALNGFSCREHIDTACKIADTTEKMSDEQLETMLRNNSFKAESLCTGCNYCKGCPVDLPISSYMQYYNSRIMEEMSDETMKQSLPIWYIWGMLAQSKVRASACIECGKCEKACTQHLPIIKRLKEFQEWEAELK